MPDPPAPLLPSPLIVRGHLVTFDGGNVIEDGALYIDVERPDPGRSPRAESAPPAGFDHATEVDTGGLVYPGLIDLHNHMAYNCLSLWVSPDRDTPWTQSRPVAARPQLQAATSRYLPTRCAMPTPRPCSSTWRPRR